MRTTPDKILSVFLLLSLSVSAQATGHIVNVGGMTPPAFTPATLTITTGDTVTFINKGGLHNVVANDGSFRCSHGCKGDAQGDTGAPSSSFWVVSLTFTQVGTIGYYCEIHGTPGQGMFGTITVQATTPVRLQYFSVD